MLESNLSSLLVVLQLPESHFLHFYILFEVYFHRKLALSTLGVIRNNKKGVRGNNDDLRRRIVAEVVSVGE